MTFPGEAMWGRRYQNGEGCQKGDRSSKNRKNSKLFKEKKPCFMEKYQKN